MSGLFQFLTWVEVVGARNDMESNAQETIRLASEEKRKREDDEIKSQFRKIYETQSIYSIDPDAFNAISARANANYNKIKNKTAPSYKIFKPLVGVGIFSFLGYNISFFKKVIENGSMVAKVLWLGAFAFLLFLGIAFVLEFFDSKDAKKRYYQQKKKLIGKLSDFHKDYSMLSLYGMYLKESVDGRIKSIYTLLRKEDSQKAENALRLLYDYFELPHNTPLRMDYDFSLLNWSDVGIEELYYAIK